IGYSFGGSTALGLAQNTELDFLVTISASLAILKESELDSEKLDRIKCPTLLIHGADDRVVPFSDMGVLSQKIGGNVDSHAISQEGHFYTNSLNSVIRETMKFVNTIWSAE
ncbi:MAG: alpha/beta hydrolase, partial [Candidatus Thorarchaeota archaeon]